MGKKETLGKSRSLQQPTAGLNLSLYMEPFLKEVCGLAVCKAPPCLKPYSRRKDKRLL